MFDCKGAKANRARWWRIRRIKPLLAETLPYVFYANPRGDAMAGAILMAKDRLEGGNMTTIFARRLF